jgi:hypothetical protein
LSVNKVTWEKVGRVTESGRYMFRFGFLVITADDLDVWKEFPNAEFTLVEQPSEGAAGEFKLGAFDISPGDDRGDFRPPI